MSISRDINIQKGIADSESTYISMKGKNGNKIRQIIKKRREDMFEGLFDRKEELFNGCRMMTREADTVQYGFSTDVLYLDDQNQLEIEFNSKDTRIQIRIDGVCTEDQDSLFQMLDGLVEYGMKYGYRRIRYGDAISDELLDMFLDYGFSAGRQGEAYTLDYEIPKEVIEDECDRRDDGESPTGCE